MKGRIIKANGVDWQQDWTTARDQFLATTAHLEATRLAANKELLTLRTTMLIEAQKRAKSTLTTCTSWPAIYSCVSKIVDQVHDKERGDKLKLALFGAVKAALNIESCKLVPAGQIAEMKELIRWYLENNL